MKCSVKECEKESSAKTFCNMHYMRFVRHGDPIFINPKCNRDGLAAQRRKEYLREWKRINRKSLRAYLKSRRARVRQATPRWADLDVIRDFYFHCPEGHHVDHVIPINHSEICGLHVIFNLQYLPGEENLEKSNKLLSELPNVTMPGPSRPKEVSEDTRKKLSEVALARYSDPGYINPNVGQKRTGQALANLHAAYEKRELPTGVEWDAAHGAQYTAEVRAKMRAAKLGKKPSNTKKIECIETGQVFEGLTEASKALGINRQSIHLQLKGKLKSAGGKHFRHT